MKLTSAHRVLPREGEAHSGDAVLTRVSAAGSLFAVIDALGHGEIAWRVAERALAVLRRQPEGIDAETAFTAVNHELHGTRGAALTLCTLHGLRADFIGAGNVACRTLGGPMPFVARPGVVGSLQKLQHPVRLELLSGQRLILHSDGISHRFDMRRLSELSPDEACDWIMSQKRYPHDDASVLVIDVRIDVQAPVEVTR